MKYIIMCGGTYPHWQTPRQLTVINGKTIVDRTAELLRQNGISEIYISTNNDKFEECGLPLLRHTNNYVCGVTKGDWFDAFYPMDEPVCYIFGDVVFSPEAIHKIVNTQTESIKFFASHSPFDNRYIKIWAEPFAFKVVDTQLFQKAIEVTRRYYKEGRFNRNPIAWELWQVIKGTQLNKIVYNYTQINDYTCDIDEPEDIAKFEEILCNT